MNKAELLKKIEEKVGFKAIVSDRLALDSPKITNTNKIEKRYFEVATTNADGTAGITFVFYLLDTLNNEAWFYNTEPEAVDIKEPTTENKKLNRLLNYLESNFHSFFVDQVNMDINTVFADVYILEVGSLVKKRVAVFKRGETPIKHLFIT